MASTILTLPTVIDLLRPISQPQEEYPLLQTLLHVIVQQLGLNQVKLDFRGLDSQKIEKLKQNAEAQAIPPMRFKVAEGLKEESVLSEDLNHFQDAGTDQRERRIADKDIAYLIESGEITVSEKKIKDVSATTFFRLENKVKSLQAQVESLGTQVLPSDEALLSKTRSGDVTPISDLLQAMNITKRMSGAEEGIDKLASLLETVAKEYADLKLLLDKMQDELGLDVVETMKEIKLAADYAKKMRPRAELYEMALIKKEKSTRMSETEDKPDDAALHSGGSDSSEGRLDDIIDNLEAVEEEEERDYEFDKFRMLPETTAQDAKINDLFLEQELIRRQMELMTAQINTLADFSEKILPEILEGLPGVEGLKKKIAEIRGKTGSEATLTSLDWEIRRNTLSMEQRLEDIESKMASHTAKLRRQDALFCDKYDSVLSQMNEVRSAILDMRFKLKMDNAEDAIFDPENIVMLMEKNGVLTEEIAQLYHEITLIKDEVTKYQTNFSGVLEEIEGMHSTKLDRFEIDDILADKADCTEVQSKVSNEIFEEFCNSLTKGVDFAIKSTADLERQWHKEMDKLLECLDRKFNKSDVDPLKQEIQNDVNELRKRLDDVARMKTYTMSAGTKKRLFTDVNCVVCDRKAAMDTEEREIVEIPKTYINAKPYIDDELEKLKKLQIMNPNAKNVLLQEKIMKSYAIASGFDLLPNEEAMFVNRYCGGAETLTNPRQRVARMPNKRAMNRSC